jgi:hypothetical protein
MLYAFRYCVFKKTKKQGFRLFALCLRKEEGQELADAFKPVLRISTES